MALRNAFENLGLDSTLQAIRDRLPTLVNGRMPTSADVTDRPARQQGYTRLATPAQAGTYEASAFPGQQSLRVSPEPSQLFIDFFDTDTIDPFRWTQHGTGVSVSIGSFLAVEPGTAAGATGGVTTVPTFSATADAYARVIWTMQVGAGTVTGNYRFIGFAQTKASPTTTDAIQNGSGFEFRPDGTFWAVMYSAGTRTFEQQLTRPTDGGWHRYSVQTKTSQTLWYLDGADVPVARALFVSPPGIMNLPVRIFSLNGATALTAATILRLGVISVADTGRNNIQLSDGVYGHRKVRIDEAGALLTATAPRRNQTAMLAQSPQFSSTAVTQIVNANANRLSLSLQNNTNTDVFVGFTSAVSSTQGLKIVPGGSLSETIWTGPLWAVAGSGSGRVVTVQEVSYT